ncbi:uncharacterized protein EDB91DRAFT_212068 [Suillus paluster]|uniref:uncharacterized protein n=1 Tax=Suillus paluster TaxID=48578 RepID=UPI001B87ECC7|nr:uncharacterized protein EDB91DRAFT_212068 [Suillus paluster]KAG1744140.1 hypothetical protein EDB91DRAFT_212068 [Suillus paluster]
MDDTGSVDHPTCHRGRLRFLTTEIREQLCQLITKSPTRFLEYLDVIHGVFILKRHFTTTFTTLDLYKRWCNAILPRDEDARSRWREDIAANFTAEQIIAVDECFLVFKLSSPSSPGSSSSSPCSSQSDSSIALASSVVPLMYSVL